MACSVTALSSIALFLLLGLAGCVAPGLSGPSEVVVAGFEASIDVGGRRIDLRLDGPVAVEGADGRQLNAYRLATSAHGADQVVTYYLDVSLHVVRVDETCSDPAQNCMHYASRDHRPAGQLPPFGVLWPTAYAHSDRLGIEGPTGFLAAEADVSSDLSTIRVREGTPLRAPPGTYRYDASRLVPQTGPTHTLVAMTAGPRLAGADAYAFQAPTGEGAPLFEDVDADPFGWDMPLGEVWDRLLQESPEARAAWAEHRCLLSFHDQDPSWNRDGPDLRRDSRDVTFVLGADADWANRYTMTISYDLFGAPSASLTATQEQGGPTRCLERSEAPDPRLPLADAERWRRDLAPTGRLMFTDVRSDDVVLPHRPIAAGWSTYWFHMAPESEVGKPLASFSDYLAIFDGITGRLIYVQTHPDDLAM